MTHYGLTIPYNVYVIREYTYCRKYTLLYIYRDIKPQGDIKSTYVDASVALPLFLDSKLRHLTLQTVTFENVLLRLGLQLPSSLVPSMFLMHLPTRGQGEIAH